MSAGAPPLRANVSLADFTTIGLGGPARYFMEARSEAEVVAALELARARELPLLVLGGGSNLLISDEGWDGLVLRIALKGVEFLEDGLVRAAAGEDWDPFVLATLESGLQGLECLSGIPGFVGGTPIQNVGAYGQEVGERIVTVRAIDRQTGEAREFRGEECGFAYRMSRFKSTDAGHFIVTGVTYALRPGGAPEIRYEELRRQLDENRNSGAVAAGPDALQTVRATVLALRRRKSMVFDPDDPNSRSLGSFFMNPMLTPVEFEALCAALRQAGLPEPPSFPAPAGVKVPAAWLIERAGFAKGYRLGGAAVSDKHTLALVNRGGTTADVLALAEQIREGVRERFGITLEREPVLATGDS